MAFETKEITLTTAAGSERTYSVTQLPAMRALKLLARLGKIAGPALAAADPGKAAEALFDRLGEDEVEPLLKRILETVQVTEEGKQRPMLTGFDLVYAGEGLAEVFHVVKFALESQYGPIFAALQAASARQDPPVAAAAAA